MFAYKSHVDEATARDFARQVFSRSHGLRETLLGAVTFIFVVGLTVEWHRLFGESWFVGALGALAVICLIATVGSFFRQLGVSSQVRREPYKDIKIGDFGISQKTHESDVILPWHVFVEAWDYPGYLMLALGKRRYLCLPKAEMPEGAREYVLQQVKQHWAPPNNALERERGRWLRKG